ncbi:TonB-dependent receptor plug domain-containing protein [Novosphingobium clariflavum]|uniref:TonB-dependent receptor plug domain-containing protein n=1 Tax=Novosphingobium clariflavum TaxID=2029884 RepID=A0ABV6S718_9SPHN|nr:TonB-dependent receptor [Novosphingobium clariflavum]
MFTRKDRLLLGAAALPALALLSPMQALAQDAEGSDQASEQPIIVTGSRIARPELDTPNPVTVVTAQDIANSGTTNLTDYLKTIPALQGSRSSYNSSGDRAGIGGTGLNLLDLRNLGTQRTLVLIDGRRQVASVDGTQSVDINTIPTDLIERVEVLTGGASAVYGADGVSGVVNFIQKKDFEGLTARVQNGLSKYGDAGQRLIAITAGHNFADGRGNFAVAWEHGEEDRLSSHSRKWLDGENKVGFFLNSADTETGNQNNDGIPDYIPLRNIRYNDTSRQGGIDVDFDGIPDFVGAQGLPYDPGTPVPLYYQQGGSGTLASDYANDLLPRINRDIVSAVFHFDFSDAFKLYAEGKYANTRSYSVAQPTWDYYLYIPEDNPYIPAAVRPYIDPDNGGVLVNRDNFDFGRRGEDITRETIRGVLGAKGDLSPNLSYDVSYVYGRSKIRSHYTNNMITDRYYAAIDAVSDGNGGVTCRVNLDPSWTPYQPYNNTRSEIPPTTFSPGDCMPLNLFGENAAGNQAALDWIMADTIDRTTLTQHVLNGAITGNSKGIFELPGGPISFALGGEYRKEKSSFVADELAAQGLTFTNSLGNTKGSFDVWEAFAEVDVPILADMPFAKRLGVNGAFRYSDYSSIGSTNAWKVGGEWAPVRDITLRGTYSKAVRAPNISELYSQVSQTYEFIDDPCGSNYLQNGTQYRVNNCQALLSSLGVADPSKYDDTRSSNIAGYSGGNPNLREETAKTWTAGVVIQPSFIPRLSITADWYDIRIKNAINTVDAQTVADLCVDQATLDNQYCSAITRQNGTAGGAKAGNIISFLTGPLNVANIRTSGLDFALNYVLPTDGYGTFGARVVGNYLHRLKQVPIPGADAVNEAYVAANVSPKFQVTTDLTWAKGPVSLDWQVNYMSAMYRYDRQTIASNPDVVAPKYLKLKERFTHDLSMTYDIDDQFQVYGGINNMFDQKPALGSMNTPISAVGRYFFLGARIKLADLFGGAK